MNYAIGDIVKVNGCEARVHEISAVQNGIGIIYIEGSKKGWEDWVTHPDAMEPVRKDIITEMND